MTDEAPCVAGSNYKLSCKLKTLQSTVEWSNENDLIAECTKDYCGLNPDFKGQYNFTSDLSENYFNLTILNVTMNFDRKKFICSVGSYSDCRILRVEGEHYLFNLLCIKYICYVLKI